MYFFFNFHFGLLFYLLFVVRSAGYIYTYPSCLENKRNHSLSVAGVLVTKILSVALVLLDGPDGHLTTAHNQEKKGRPVLSDQQKGKPSQSFKKVVGERNQVEAVAARDLAVLGAVSTQRRKVKMCPKVGKFSKKPQGSEHMQLEGTEGDDMATEKKAGKSRALSASVGGRRVNKVRKVKARENPVVARVFEDVERGHGSKGEAVNKSGFDLTLQEMEHDKDKGKLLDPGVVKGLAVDSLLAKVKDWVDDKRAKVLNEVDSAPAQLGAEVLDANGDGLGVSTDVVRQGQIVGERNVPLDTLAGLGRSLVVGRVGHGESDTMDRELAGLGNLLGEDLDLGLVRKLN